jgi:hypothetical protein
LLGRPQDMEILRGFYLYKKITKSDPKSDHATRKFRGLIPWHRAMCLSLLLRISSKLIQFPIWKGITQIMFKRLASVYCVFRGFFGHFIFQIEQSQVRKTTIQHGHLNAIFLWLGIFNWYCSKENPPNRGNAKYLMESHKCCLIFF